MDEYVERAALLKKLKEAGAICSFGEHLIEQFPAADVAPICTNCGAKMNRGADHAST